MTGSSVHSSPRHLAGRSSLRGSLRPTLAWPGAALGLLVLIGVRASAARAVPGEGRLSAAGYLLAATGSLPAGTRVPDRAAAVVLAGYAWLTRSFGRHASVLGAGRELVVLAVLVSAVLLWATVRRLGFGDAGGAVAILLVGCPLLLRTAALADEPAVLALPPLVLAGCLVAPGRPTALARVLALLCCALAVVLAPDVLIVLVSLVAASLAVRRGRSPLVLAITVACAAGLLVATVALRRAGGPEPSALSAVAVAAAAVELAVGLLGTVAASRGRRLLPPRLAAPAVALAVTALVALVPPPHASAVVVALPIAALVGGAFADVAAARARRGPADARRAASGVAAVLLIAAAAAAVVVPVGPAPDGEPAATLLRWTRAQLPAGTRLAAPPLAAAELLRAGAPGSMLAGGTGSGRGDLAVVPRTPPPGSAVLGRFTSPGTDEPLLLVDRHPGRPTAAQLHWRLDLGAALLANPASDVPPAGVAPLRSGRVDPRLLAVLAALAARPGIAIGALPTTAGGEGCDVRQALVTSTGGQRVGLGRPATAGLLAYLRAQRAPYVPDAVTVTGDGVLIRYRWLRDPDAAVTRAGG